MRIQLTATGVAGHGSVPLETNSILKLSQAVAAVGAWKPPIQLERHDAHIFHAAWRPYRRPLRRRDIAP